MLHNTVQHISVDPIMKLLIYHCVLHKRLLVWRNFFSGGNVANYYFNGVVSYRNELLQLNIGVKHHPALFVVTEQIAVLFWLCSCGCVCMSIGSLMYLFINVWSTRIYNWVPHFYCITVFVFLILCYFSVQRYKAVYCAPPILIPHIMYIILLIFRKYWISLMEVITIIQTKAILPL